MKPDTEQGAAEEHRVLGSDPAVEAAGGRTAEKQGERQRQHVEAGTGEVLPESVAEEGGRLKELWQQEHGTEQYAAEDRAHAVEHPYGASAHQMHVHERVTGA
jgi:hypothetical protein